MNEINKDLFVSRFRYFLHYTKLSRKQIALSVGCSTTTLNRWKKGESLPSPQQMEKVTRFLGLETTEAINVPFPNDWTPAKIDGLTIEEWRRRAIIAEMQLDRLRKELEKTK